MAIHQGPSKAPTFASVTATGDKWLDIAAAGATFYTTPLGIWDMPSTEYIRTDQNGHKALFVFSVRPGDVIDKYRVEYQGESANDGISMRLVSRVGLAASWTAVEGPETSSGVAQSLYADIMASPLTVVAGTVYAVEVTSTLGDGVGLKIFAAGLHTTSRSL